MKDGNGRLGKAMDVIGKVRFLLLVGLAGLFLAGEVRAQDNPDAGAAPPQESGTESGGEFQGYDKQIEDLKKEILDLNTQLFRLQEDLLFPEDSSVVVFLSVEGGNYFTLDSVKLNLDDKMVGGYLYTDREMMALRKGGVQRLYTGNVKSGDHRITAIFTGSGPNEKDYKRAEDIAFTKETGPVFIKLIVRDDPDRKQPNFVYESWK